MAMERDYLGTRSRHCLHGLAWVFTHVRSADPNYLSGIGSFLTMLAGVFIVASGSGVMKEFRRSKVYEDFALPEKVIEPDLVPV